MPVQLRDAMEECLEGWRGDLPVTWQTAFGEVSLGFDAIDPALTLEP